MKTYREIQFYIEELQAEAEGIKDEITAEMAARETEKMIVDVFKVRYKTVVSKRLDSKRLQLDYGIYAVST